MGLPVPCPKFGDNVYNAVKNSRFNRIKNIFTWSLQSQQTRIGKQVQGEKVDRKKGGKWSSNKGKKAGQSPEAGPAGLRGALKCQEEDCNLAGIAYTVND